MDTFSIYGEKQNSADLLYLKSNTSNVQLQFHNITTNFTVDYTDNIISTTNDTLKYNTEFDSTNHVVHTSLVETNRERVQVKSITQNFQIESGGLILTDSSSTWLSKHVFSSTTDDRGDYFTSTLNDAVKNIHVLDDASVILADGSISTLVPGVGFEFELEQPFILGSFKMYGNNLKSLPENLRIFALSGSYWNEIHNGTHIIPNQEYNIDTVGLNVTKYAVIIDTLYILQENFNNDLNTDNIRNSTNNYRLQIGYMEFYAKPKIQNNYTMDMMNNSITDVHLLRANKILLNDRLYTNFLTLDDVADMEFRLSDYTTPDKFRGLLVPSDNDLNINGIIPHTINQSDTEFTFGYSSNVSVKHIKQLHDASTTRTEGIVILDVDGNVNKSSHVNEISTNSLFLNNNKIEWNNHTSQFVYGNSNEIIQSEIFKRITVLPDTGTNITILDTKTITGLTNSQLELKYILSGTQYVHTIRQPFGFDYSGTDSKFANLENFARNSQWITRHIGFRSTIIGILDSNGDVIESSSDDSTSTTNYIYTYVDKDGNTQLYADFYEYESTNPIILHKLSFRHSTDDTYNSVRRFVLLAYIPETATTPGNWTEIMNVTELNTTMRGKDIIFDVNADKPYSIFRIGIKSVAFRGPTNIIDNPCVIEHLKFHGHYLNNSMNSILYNDDIDNLNINNLSVSNKMFVNENSSPIVHVTAPDIISQERSIVIQEDETGVIDITISRGDILKITNLSTSVLNINGIDYSNRLIKWNADSIGTYPYTCGTSSGTITVNEYVLENNIKSVDILKLSSDDTNIVHNISINYNSNVSYYNMSFDSSNVVSMTKDRVNVTTTSGLYAYPNIGVYSQSGNSSVAFQIQDLTDTDTNTNYVIDLPNNLGNVLSFLYIESIDTTNNIVHTSWKTVDEELFQGKNVFMGKTDNTNILSQFDANFVFTNNPPGGDTIVENLTHVRKIAVGMPEVYDVTSMLNDHVMTVAGSVYASVDITTDSDMAYKHSLEKIDTPRQKIQQLTGYTFNRNDTNLQRRFCGLIAQDVEKVLPEAILKKHDGKLRVMYNNISGLFVECFKELYEEIDMLKSKL